MGDSEKAAASAALSAATGIPPVGISGGAGGLALSDESKSGSSVGWLSAGNSSGGNVSVNTGPGLFSIITYAALGLVGYWIFRKMRK